MYLHYMILHIYAMSVIIAQEVNQMNSDKFEKSFNDFLEREEYDEAENALFAIARSAFTAGWLAAGGEPLKPKALFELMRKADKDNSSDK